MENLRWILILAGVGILVLLYFSGRPPRSLSQRDSLNKSRATSGRASDTLGSSDPLMGEMMIDDPMNAHDGFDDQGYADDINAGIDDGYVDEFAEEFGDIDNEFSDFDRTAGGSDQSFKLGGLASFSSKIESFTEKLSAKRRSRAAAVDYDEPVAKKPTSHKIVSLHLVAPAGKLFNGEQLLELFEERGYHYGDMNIFHSMHDGKPVFSICKLVEPGVFDINDVSSFDTPGITMILQLPGPVVPDVAFEVLVSEAFDMANALGGSVLAADRSTLSRQTVQHMREGIFEFMHHQKHFAGVAS